MSEIRMKSLQFRKERENGWLELESLVKKVEKSGLNSLTALELSRLPVLYRSALSSLSVARSISLDNHLLVYLESLVRRSYLVVYGVRDTMHRMCRRFFLSLLPQTIRLYRWATILAAAFFFSGIAAGYMTVQRDSDAFYAIVPPTLQEGRGPASSTEKLREALYYGKDKGVIEYLWAFATFLFTHNAQIGILSFSIGVVAGVPVFYLLFTNGEMLGAFASVYHQHGLSLEFWGWILPHGVTEMGAMVLCGAAGLMLAFGFISPGRRTRLQSLVLVGRTAGRIVVGALFMFFIAALIEGLFRQLVHDTAARYAMACATVALWTAYFGFVGRGEKRH